MSNHTKPTYADYIHASDKFWFEKIAPHIPKERTLKIGNGFGHASEMIRPHTQHLEILEVCTYPETINSPLVNIYDGFPIPYADKSFDTTVVMFTLHHIPNNRRYLSEIFRVTKKRIIILEETYSNVFQKLHLYYRDWKVNTKAGQPCELHWNSYFSRDELSELNNISTFKETYRFTKKHKTYFKELMVLDSLT